MYIRSAFRMPTSRSYPRHQSKFREERKSSPGISPGSLLQTPAFPILTTQIIKLSRCRPSVRICSVFSEKEPLGINGTSLPSEFEIFFATIVNAEIKGASFQNLKILMFTFYITCITCTYFYTPKIKFKECFPLVIINELPTLNINFPQITFFLKVHVAFVFECQTLYLIHSSNMN